jgi:hypothetical protein
MTGRSWWEKRRVAFGLGAIVLGAAALALAWVFLVPIYQSPDEHQHLDYALCIRDRGGLFTAEAVPPGIPCYIIHPESLYLISRVDLNTVAFNPDAKVAPDYGTRDFFRAIDAGAPRRGPLRTTVPPSLLASYPYGYYAVLAVWLGALRLAGASLVVAFFAARVFSVVLLAASLVLTYGMARELGHRRRFALFLTAIVGFFPLTTFIASYVQPDNLSFALVSLCLYSALRALRRPEDGRVIALLGLALGALCVTKLHFFACAAAVTLPMVAVAALRWPAGRSRLWRAALLVAPTLALGSIHLWSIWGCPNYHTRGAEAPDRLLFTITWLKRALIDFYSESGATHRSFWGVFGWMDTPLVIGGPRTDAAFRFAVQAATWTVLALTLVRLQHVVVRLAGLVRRGRSGSAARIAVSNPLINGYFLFTVLMVLLYVRTGNRFGAQGRNWLPFLPGILLTALVYAPRALAGRGAQRACARLLATGLALYVAFGGYYAVRTIQRRYYMPQVRHRTHNVRMTTRPVILHDLNWKDGIGDAQGPDPYAVFALARPEFVHRVRLRFVLSGPSGPDSRTLLQAYWTRAGREGFSSDRRVANFRLPTGPHEQTLVISVRDDLDHLRLDPGEAGCHFELREMVLLAAGPDPVPWLTRAGRDRQ